MKELFFEPRGLYYRINTFRDDRPTLVFMHGLSGHSTAMKPYEVEFGDSYNILSFDLRGHGKSRKYASYDSYKISDFADDLYELLKFLNINQCILLTHSFGCLIALEFIKHHQEMLLKLILMSPNFNVHRPIAYVIKPFLFLSRILELVPFRATAVGYHFDYTPHRNAHDWDIPMTFNDVRNTGLRAYLFSSLQALTVNYDDLLEKISIPTLLIHGRKDTIFPIRNTIIMEKRIPNAQLVILEEGDHIIIVNTSYFPRIVEAVKGFL